MQLVCKWRNQAASYNSYKVGLLELFMSLLHMQHIFLVFVVLCYWV